MDTKNLSDLGILHSVSSEASGNLGFRVWGFGFRV